MDSGARGGVSHGGFEWPNQSHILRPYGAIAPRVVTPTSKQGIPDRPSLLMITNPEVVTAFGISATPEPSGVTYWSAYERPWFPWPRSPIYRTLLPHLSFSGAQIVPIWKNAAGRTVIAWWTSGRHRMLLVGLDVESEIIRYRQGDPERAESQSVRSAWGFEWERPAYLYDGQILPDYATTPWADRLGYCLAERWAELSGEPLLEPLPFGARGLIILTGDDDQAHLEKYAEQLAAIGNVPITYFLHPQTKHTSETIRSLGSQVQIGLHPDALTKPEAYDDLCADQAHWIEQLCGSKIRLVRNHGYLNRGYLGHLSAWERNGLELDVNCPGVDGTALNGSFLPMRVRRRDGTWSAHFSLLTAFGDGMVYALKLTQRQATKRVRRLVKQIEATRPGVLVFNFHPQNIADTRQLHGEIRSLAGRQGWHAMGLESYLNWVQGLDALAIEQSEGSRYLKVSRPMEGLVLRAYSQGGWNQTFCTTVSDRYPWESGVGND